MQLARTYLLLVCVWPLLSLAQAAVLANPPVSWFSTGGETVYHLKAARTSPGMFSLHRLPGLELQGEPRVTKESFVYQMVTVDTDGDGLDEIAFGGQKGGGLFDATGKRISALQERNTGRGQHV